MVSHHQYAPLSTAEGKQPPARPPRDPCCSCCCTKKCWKITGIVLVALYMYGSIMDVIYWRHSKNFWVRNTTGGLYDIHDWMLKWQGYRMDVPLWAQKNLSLEIPETERQMCFVHVGKTAGTTLACYMGFLYPECFQWANATNPPIPMAPGLLAASTTRVVHDSYNDCTSQKFDYYLFVVRNPLARLQSWFTYERPKQMNNTIALASERHDRQNQLFVECGYLTLNELGEKGLDPNNRDDFDSTQQQPTLAEREYVLYNDTIGDYNRNICQFRAHMAIAGYIGYSTHNYYNFNYYLQQVQRNDTGGGAIDIAVIRTEHLFDDWKGIEEDLLHGPKDLNVTFARKNASKKTPEDSYLSDLARLRICAALCEEIQVYKELLERAVNLNENDIAVSMAELKMSCPLEAAREDCELIP